MCGAVFIAAGMVGENWLKVSISAMALGLGLYLIPLGMIANPNLIALESAPLEAILAFAKVALALALISAGVIRSSGGARRVLLVGAGALILLAPMDFA